MGIGREQRTTAPGGKVRFGEIAALVVDATAIVIVNTTKADETIISERLRGEFALILEFKVVRATKALGKRTYEKKRRSRQNWSSRVYEKPMGYGGRRSRVRGIT